MSCNLVGGSHAVHSSRDTLVTRRESPRGRLKPGQVPGPLLITRGEARHRRTTKQPPRPKRERNREESGEGNPSENHLLINLKKTTLPGMIENYGYDRK